MPFRTDAEQVFGEHTESGATDVFSMQTGVREDVESDHSGPDGICFLNRGHGRG